MAIGTPRWSGVTSGTATGTSSLTVSIPAGAAAGDYAMLAVTVGSGNSIVPTVDSGWAVLQQAYSSTNYQLNLYTRVLSAADMSAGSFTVTISSGRQMIVELMTAAGAIFDTISTPQTGTNSLAIPAVTPSADNSLLVAWFGALPLTSNRATTVTPPSGFAAGSFQQTTITTAQRRWLEAATKTLGTGTAGVTQGPWTYTSDDNNTGADNIATVVVLKSGGAPAPSFTATANGLTLSVNAGASTPAGGSTIAAYDWNWGDGGAVHGSGVTASHTYAAAGTYTVTLTVTDADGGSAATTYTVQVADAASTNGAGITALAAGWTNSSGTLTPQQVLNDGAATTFIQSDSNPTGSVQVIPLEKLTWATGQDLTVALSMDVLGGTSGSAVLTLKQGATTVASSSALPLTVGSGSSVTAAVSYTFPAANLTGITDPGALSLSVSVTAA